MDAPALLFLSVGLLLTDESLSRTESTETVSDDSDVEVSELLFSGKDSSKRESMLSEKSLSTSSASIFPDTVFSTAIEFNDLNVELSVSITSSDSKPEE